MGHMRFEGKPREISLEIRLRLIRSNRLPQDFNLLKYLFLDGKRTEKLVIFLHKKSVR